MTAAPLVNYENQKSFNKRRMLVGLPPPLTNDLSNKLTKEFKSAFYPDDLLCPMI
jgi:hypothetical protein